MTSDSLFHVSAGWVKATNWDIFMCIN